MSDDLLAAGLIAWLEEHDEPPPDPRMSASRVMAGVELTPQLGRWWPPKRLIGRVGPMPALGAVDPGGVEPRPRPRPRPETPPLGERIRAAVTPVRALAVMVALTLVSGSVLIGWSLLPRSSQPVALATASSSPTLGTTMAPRPAPSTPAPTISPPSPGPTLPPSDRTLDWRGAGLRLEADGVSLRVKDRSYTAPADAETLVPLQPAGGPDHLLEVAWREDDRDHRLVLEVARDDEHWWVARIRTSDGTRKAMWISFEDTAEATRTPLGEALEADLRLGSTGAERKGLREAGSAELALDALRLTRLVPGP